MREREFAYPHAFIIRFDIDVHMLCEYAVSTNFYDSCICYYFPRRLYQPLCHEFGFICCQDPTTVAHLLPLLLLIS